MAKGIRRWRDQIQCAGNGNVQFVFAAQNLPPLRRQRRGTWPPVESYTAKHLGAAWNFGDLLEPHGPGCAAAGVVRNFEGDRDDLHQLENSCLPQGTGCRGHSLPCGGVGHAICAPGSQPPPPRRSRPISEMFRSPGDVGGDRGVCGCLRGRPDIPRSSWSCEVVLDMFGVIVALAVVSGPLLSYLVTVMA